MSKKEQMNIVVVGHVDHGKSTVVGRLLADTHSLPKGKLEQVKAQCERNSKPFEYAFLLDALKDEQAQGITIDTARCFFKTQTRDYILIDAPGHVEFLKNMISGAARAEAALLVIDAHEGIRENSKRHGTMLSLLGIKQIAILVNKMDLVNYDISVFNRIQKEYREFLSSLGLSPTAFIPISARNGDNIAQKASWYHGITVLEQLDSFTKESSLEEKPFRFPLQDIYKFTENNDERRIFAGTVETGTIQAGDEVIFFPSQKRSKIETIETFNRLSQKSVAAGSSTGFTLHDEIYVRPGEILCKTGDQPPLVRSKFRANLFWMGKSPLLKNKRYKLKIATMRIPVQLVQIIKVIDASELASVQEKSQVERHEVAECILETTKPIAFDLFHQIEATGRFVIVDHYEIAGGGIITEIVRDQKSIWDEHILERENLWEKSGILPAVRSRRYGHKAKFILILGSEMERISSIGKTLEKALFERDYKAYYFGISNIDYGLDFDLLNESERSDEEIRGLGELARILTDSGQIFITSLTHLDDFDLEILRKLNEPNEILFIAADQELSALNHANLIIPQNANESETIRLILDFLKKEEIIPEYQI